MSPLLTVLILLFSALGMAVTVGLVGKLFFLLGASTYRHFEQKRLNKRYPKKKLRK